MELKINMQSSTASLGMQFGITKDRIDELFQKLDDLMEDLMQRAVPPTSIAEIAVEIAKFCNTNEELVFCTISNTIMLYKSGILDTESYKR